MEITSRDNPTFRELLKLTDKRWRKRTNKCIIEGEKIVRENLQRAEKVFVRHGKTFENAIVLGTKLFDEISSLENSTGVMAIISKPTVRALTFPYLVLDGIQDAGNAGALLRSALAFGFNTVMCIDCVDIWSPKVLRASSGVQFNLNIVECGAKDFIKPAKSWLVAADLGGECIETFRAKDLRFGLVLGSEGKGVSERMKGLIERTVTIPMKKSVESLNVAVAGGILMYELGGRIK
jgi:TrmH family RNA methyltransferase